MDQREGVDWAYHIQNIKTYKGRKAEYCRDHGINYKHFIYRESRQNKVLNHKKPKFIPIDIPSGAIENPSSCVFSVKLRSSGIMSAEIDCNNSLVKSVISSLIQKI
ncbi:MAG: hypothetical protein KBD78_13660 [Oligoflexales bacterium]|nr:hypothetical protein [Oligoflexales bacterium]